MQDEKLQRLMVEIRLVQSREEAYAIISGPVNQDPKRDSYRISVRNYVEELINGINTFEAAINFIWAKPYGPETKTSRLLITPPLDSSYIVKDDIRLEELFEGKLTELFSKGVKSANDIARISYLYQIRPDSIEAKDKMSKICANMISYAKSRAQLRKIIEKINQYNPNCIVIDNNSRPIKAYSRIFIECPDYITYRPEEIIIIDDEQIRDSISKKLSELFQDEIARCRSKVESIKIVKKYPEIHSRQNHILTRIAIVQKTWP